MFTSGLFGFIWSDGISLQRFVYQLHDHLDGIGGGAGGGAAPELSYTGTLGDSIKKFLSSRQNEKSRGDEGGLSFFQQSHQ